MLSVTLSQVCISPLVKGEVPSARLVSPPDSVHTVAPRGVPPSSARGKDHPAPLLPLAVALYSSLKAASS